MSSYRVRNIGLADYRKYLEHIGCKLIRTKGGHFQYSRKDLGRPLTLQTHIDPVPEFIILNHLRVLGIKKTDFLNDFFSM